MSSERPPTPASMSSSSLTYNNNNNDNQRTLATSRNNNTSNSTKTTTTTTTTTSLSGIKEQRKKSWPQVDSMKDATEPPSPLPFIPTPSRSTPITTTTTTEDGNNPSVHHHHYYYYLDQQQQQLQKKICINDTTETQDLSEVNKQEAIRASNNSIFIYTNMITSLFFHVCSLVLCFPLSPPFKVGCIAFQCNTNFKKITSDGYFGPESTVRSCI